jgi:K(+)-stimulated pyrophosphate-energized sodium pump
MAADLFETYAVTVVATMVLASIFFTGNVIMMIYPMAICAACVITSILGTYFVKLGKNNSIMGALYRGFIATAILSLIVLYFVTDLVVGFNTNLSIDDISFTGLDLYICGVIGLAITGLIIWITEYYTGVDYRPVQSIAKSSETGHGTNVIQGLAVSMESTALPALVIVFGIIVTYSLAGLFGIAIAVTTMLALAGMVVALDAFGPVTDNAGGIAEMSELPEDVRNTTDALDAVGNTTKAVTKGYAIGSAGLGALVLFGAYTADIDYFTSNAVEGSYFYGVSTDFSLSNPYVVVGLLVGGMLPYLFAAMGMTAVGRAGSAIVEEVRLQFKEKPGIMTGKDKPDYSRAVDLLTKSAIKEMIIPSLLPLLSPVILFYFINFIATKGDAFSALGAMLLGVIVTGLFVALSMTAGGGAWDNAKKYIEDGNHGGKGSEAHKAAVTGDTVGDPYKDTAGPAINPMIKITNIVALLLLAILAH